MSSTRVVRVKDAVVVYPGSHYRALDGVSIEARPGEITALVGPSGSGKTTLIRLIAGFIRPDRGDVYYGTLRLSSLSGGEIRRLRRDMGISFQDPILVPSLTIRENIEFSIEAAGRKPDSYEERVHALADKLGIARLLDRLPGQVSGGEQRRAHLLMALAHEPPILLLDEPTAYLDEESSRRVIEIMRGEAEKGRTIIVATHDPAVEEAADRVYRLRYGRLASTR